MSETTTHKDIFDSGLPLEDHELDGVSGGAPSLEQQQAAAENKKQADALKGFQQLLQELP
jgi:hypothetical protein